jgi:hypothetical protein
MRRCTPSNQVSRFAAARNDERSTGLGRVAGSTQPIAEFGGVAVLAFFSRAGGTLEDEIGQFI